MNYAEATGYIQRLNKFGMKLGLERVERLLGLLGNPQKSFRSVLVGGTSGKGSTTVMIGAVLREAGYRTGVFVKPHLSDFMERISIDGKMISERDFVSLVGKIKPFAERMRGEGESPTFFEFITAVAFEYFREQRVQFAAVEVGLGGRLDATNTLTPDVCVITHVSLEHTDILGNTVEKIAREKAGIVKMGGILVTGANEKALTVIEKICSERKAKLIKAAKLNNVESSEKGNSFDFEGMRIFIQMAGRFQINNAACALAALRALKPKISLDAIKKGFEKTRWIGRFELVNWHPKVLLDGAKDVTSMRSLAESLDLIKYDKLYTVFSASKDKLVPQMMAAIAVKTDFFVLAGHKVMGRAAGPEELAKEAKKHGKDFLVIEDVKSAVRKAIALAGDGDLILVTGSLFAVGEARELWFRKKARMGREFNENVRTGR
ncbi:MAG: folylpolyglutamate synthase/dihydrofolate synthase family protein [Candidatus Aenigmatarchaeota archaeon]